MYDDLVIRDELFQLTPKKFDLTLLMCQRIQQLDQGHMKAVDTMKQDLLECVIEEIKEDALISEVAEPEEEIFTEESVEIKDIDSDPLELE